ncbi:mucin-binding protein [Lacticaseibacillus zhaodongensis]|uniref:mucin-binding protein n=1 Tax=Lacticaseibacillus zhaodongensis TaxID=2668065 RepID=UPI0012D2A244|nr:hypothetical protein [Lacticaseibacillus zhaodongensis]
MPAGASVTPDKYYDNTDGDAQHAALVYFDDTTQKVLHTDTLTGNTGTAITFDPAAKIKQYRAAGYDLVTDGYDPAATFDADDSTTQTFTVHLLHTTSQKTVTKPVTRTIVYVIADGAVAAPAVVNQPGLFTSVFGT